MSVSWSFSTTPIGAVCTLRHDTGGWTITAVPTTLSDGRPGQMFAIPDGTANGHGAMFTVTALKKVPIEMRGVLMLSATEAWMKFDDFHLADATTTLPRLVLDGHTLKQDVS